MLSEKEKRNRVLRLAEKYGPFIRFYPEGLEEVAIEDGDAKKDANKDTLGAAIKDGEKAELKDNAEFDKVQQRADQEAANAKKAREQLSESQEYLESARTENESLKEQLVAAEAKAADAGIKDVELDESKYEGTDIALVKAIQVLKDKIDAKDKRIDGLEKKAVSIEAEGRKDKTARARNAAYEELLGDLDDEYGSDCRNEAVKKFNELIKAGEVPKGNTAKSTLILDKCYKDAKAAKSKDSKKKTSLSLDSGSGGGNAPSLVGTEIKEGSLDEVDAQVAKTEFGARKVS